MKTHILSLLLFLTFSANCQTTNKEPGQECYKAGKVVLDKLIKKETTRLNQHFPENTLKKLVELIAKKEEKKTDIYFDYRNGRYIFTIFSGRHIDNGTDWGLYEYLFITTITFDYVNNAAKIISTNTIFEDKSEKKKWWQSFMDSYNDKGFKRKEWADKYGLIPPPPPPPETTAWFEK